MYMYQVRALDRMHACVAMLCTSLVAQILVSLLLALCAPSDALTGSWVLTGRQLPDTSLEHVPVGYFGGNSEPRPAANLDMLAKMRVVSIEKWEGKCWNECLANITAGAKKCSPACGQEATMLQTLRAVKRRIPRVAGLFYTNSFMDFEFYELHARMAEAGALLLDANTKELGTVTNDNGMSGITVFDLAQPVAQRLWLELVANVTATGLADGIFIDKTGTKVLPSNATGTGWAIQNRDKDSPIAVTEAHARQYNAGKAHMLASLPPSAGAWNATMKSIVLKNVEKDPKHMPLKLQSAINSTLKKTTFAYLKTDDQKTDHDPTDISSACSDDLIAAFLLALQKGVFLGCNGWDSRFDLPLGDPVGPMQEGHDGSLSRQFASGTNVSWFPDRPKGQMGQIVWAKA